MVDKPKNFTSGPEHGTQDPVLAAIREGGESDSDVDSAIWPEVGFSDKRREPKPKNKTKPNF